MAANWLSRVLEKIIFPIFGHENVIASAALPGACEYYEKKEKALAKRRAEAKAEQETKRKAAREESERLRKEQEDEERNRRREVKSRSKLFKIIDEEEKFLAKAAAAEAEKQGQARWAEQDKLWRRRESKRKFAEYEARKQQAEQKLSASLQTPDSANNNNTLTPSAPSKKAGETPAQRASKNATKRMAEAKAAQESTRASQPPTASETSLNTSSSDDSNSNSWTAIQARYREWLIQQAREKMLQDCAVYHPLLDQFGQSCDQLYLAGRTDLLKCTADRMPYCRSCLQYVAPLNFWRYLDAPREYWQKVVQPRERPFWLLDTIPDPRFQVEGGEGVGGQAAGSQEQELGSWQQSMYSKSVPEVYNTAGMSGQVSAPQPQEVAVQQEAYSQPVPRSQEVSFQQQSTYSNSYLQVYNITGTSGQVPVLQPQEVPIQQEAYSQPVTQSQDVPMQLQDVPMQQQSIFTNLDSEMYDTSGTSAEVPAPQPQHAPTQPQSTFIGHNSEMNDITTTSSQAPTSQPEEVTTQPQSISTTPTPEEQNPTPTSNHPPPPPEIDWSPLSTPYTISPITDKEGRINGMREIFLQIPAFLSTHAFDAQNITSPSKWESVIRGHETEFAAWCQTIVNTVVGCVSATGKKKGKTDKSRSVKSFKPWTKRSNEQLLRARGLLGEQFDALCEVFEYAGKGLKGAPYVRLDVCGELRAAREHFRHWEGLGDGYEVVDGAAPESGNARVADGAPMGAEATSARRPLQHPGGQGAGPIAFQMV